MTSLPDELRRLAGIRRGPRWATIAASYGDAKRVATRKGLWMVQYLRARRSGDTLIGYFRRNHLSALEAQEKPE